MKNIGIYTQNDKEINQIQIVQELIIGFMLLVMILRFQSVGHCTTLPFPGNADFPQ